jgi:hypothetical protein
MRKLGKKLIILGTILTIIGALMYTNWLLLWLGIVIWIYGDYRFGVFK